MTINIDKNPRHCRVVPASIRYNDNEFTSYEMSSAVHTTDYIKRAQESAKRGLVYWAILWVDKAKSITGKKFDDFGRKTDEIITEARLVRLEMELGYAEHNLTFYDKQTPKNVKGHLKEIYGCRKNISIKDRPNGLNDRIKKIEDELKVKEEKVRPIPTQLILRSFKRFFSYHHSMDDSISQESEDLESKVYEENPNQLKFNFIN